MTAMDVMDTTLTTLMITYGRQLLRRLADAEGERAAAVARLRRARLDALTGRRYDAAELDRLVVDYRTAHGEADAALSRWLWWWWQARRYAPVAAAFVPADRPAGSSKRARPAFTS
jgi:MoxR-like ATPase